MAMPIRSTYRTLLKSLLQPRLILRARKAIGTESLSSIKLNYRFHYLRVTKRNTPFKNQAMKLREAIYSFHYTTLNKVFDKGCVELFVEGGAVLWRSELDPALTIVLKQGVPEYRDGEIELQFRQEARTIFVMGFVIIPPNSIYKKSEYGVLVTRVQGTPEYLKVFKGIKDSVLDVGVNHLLFAALRGVAAYIGVKNIYGVGTHLQSYVLPERFARFDKCYDQFWELLQATKMPNGFYQIPIPYVDKDITLISQHHRSRARRKRGFKNSIIESVFSSIRILNPYAANRLSNSWFLPKYQLDN